ncbi:hypothetical protein [Bradyrhizobium sp. HKCCYLS20291]|uniref:hypothetical protein n=1 Tax=Bradyrhizobium sp. HKCCYLS20291 TaxID=3420766 RepID=UPI003EBD3684
MSIISTLLQLFRRPAVRPAAAVPDTTWPLWRQGDILIRRVDKIPDQAQRSPVPHGILAHGELTGHSHRLERPQSALLFQGAITLGEFFLDARRAGARIVHEEHGPIELPSGQYRVWRQREYAQREIRVVGD